MTATSENTGTPVFNFSHKTFILKPTFKIGDATVNNTSISKITMRNVVNPNTDIPGQQAITITPSSLENIFIFIPYTIDYIEDYEFVFDVTVSGTDYSATLSLPATPALAAGNIYTSTLSLAAPI